MREHSFLCVNCSFNWTKKVGLCEYGIIVTEHSHFSCSLVIPFLDVYKKSACKTRELLVDIIQEYPDEIEHTYIPSCVVLMRCAGCCNDEALECVPTETRNVTMEVRLVQSSVCSPSPCFL